MAQAGQHSPAVNLGAGGFQPTGLVSYFDDGGATVTFEESRAAFNQLPEEEQLRIEAERRETEMAPLADLERMVDFQGQLPKDFKFGGKYGLPSYLAYTGGVPFDKGRVADMRTFGHDPDNPGGGVLITRGGGTYLGKYYHPSFDPEAEQGIGSLEKKATAERFKGSEALAATTVGGIGSLEPDTIYYQQGLPFDDPSLNAHYPETAMTPGGVVMHELLHRQSQLPEIRESYTDYASTLGALGAPHAITKIYRDAGKGHGLTSLLEAAMNRQEGWPNPEAITKLMEENPKLSLEEARQAVEDTGDIKFGDQLTDHQDYRLEGFAKFNEEFGEFLREKGKGDPRFLIPRDEPPEPEPPTVMDTIRKQYEKILGRKPED